MTIDKMTSKIILWVKVSRAEFFTASIIPVLVGTAVAFSAKGVFDPGLFLLALFTVVALHAGGNLTNEYFDHKSGNDWLSENPSPYSGGSQIIQTGQLASGAVLLAALTCFSIAGLLGLIIIIKTQSLLLLALGVFGILAGFFYTAGPVRLVYRGFGEIFIAIAFGICPVFGSYYVQTLKLDFVPLAPACIIAMLVFLILLINEFPDLKADAAVRKKTLPVRLGPGRAVWIYRVTLLATYIPAVIMLFSRQTFLAGLLYLLSLPAAIFALKNSDVNSLLNPTRYISNKLTILLHISAGVLISIGLTIPSLLK